MIQSSRLTAIDKKKRNKTEVDFEKWLICSSYIPKLKLNKTKYYFTK